MITESDLICDVSGIFKAVYGERLQELLLDERHPAFIKHAHESNSKQEKICMCDLNTIIMVTGCICGGK